MKTNKTKQICVGEKMCIDNMSTQIKDLF